MTTGFERLVEAADEATKGDVFDRAGDRVYMDDVVEAVLLRLRDVGQDHVVLKDIKVVRDFIDRTLTERFVATSAMQDGDVIEVFSDREGVVNGVVVRDRQFVVEQARSTGGGTGHGPHDVYPNGYQITARALRPDGTYDPDGESIVFMQKGQPGSGNYTNQAAGRIVRKMVKGYV